MFLNYFEMVSYQVAQFSCEFTILLLSLPSIWDYKSVPLSLAYLINTMSIKRSFCNPFLCCYNLLNFFIRENNSNSTFFTMSDLKELFFFFFTNILFYFLVSKSSNESKYLLKALFNKFDLLLWRSMNSSYS